MREIKFRAKRQDNGEWIRSGTLVSFHSGDTTVLMVTHNVEIAKMADRVVKLRSGRVSSVKYNEHPLHADDLVW